MWTQLLQWLRTSLRAAQDAAPTPPQELLRAAAQEEEAGEGTA
ncbi:MAG TPA: hypothetical protein VFB38_05190 [Chthonomonadaceae bacterium]|nr:hypothetical protein [Chthonomonadaceae bacterium]